MKVLVACEESQRVCTAFREKGHEAYSCDVLECSGGHPEWHIQGDVLPLINGNCKFKTMDGQVHEVQGSWDLLIAHPPCTYLSNAGACRLYKKIDGKTYIDRDRFEKGHEAKVFFEKFWYADCKRVAVENPTPSAVYHLPDYSQIIQPYEYGHPYTKRTCLWLRGLPPLIPTNIVEPVGPWVCGNAEIWKNQAANGIVYGKEKDPRHRSKTFIGIAKAMADQWG